MFKRSAPTRSAANLEASRPTRITRREMLRFGGLAAVGTAGAAVATVVGATPADAAAGSKVVLGAPNDAGTSATTLNSANPAETLRVANVANGGAIQAITATTAARPAIASTSNSAQPAVEATGMPIAAGGAVAAAGNGPALSVEGVAAFSRSGIATVPIGSRSVTVNVPGGLSASSGAFALNQGDGALVGSAVPDPATGTLTIWMIGPRSIPMTVAWFVFG